MIRVGLIATLLFMSGCAGSTAVKDKEFSFIHFNDPECVGMSGSGIILYRTEDKEVVRAEIAQKSGYCETIGGQAITSGADIAGDYLLQKGLSQSGNTTKNSLSGVGPNATGTGQPPSIQ